MRRRLDRTELFTVAGARVDALVIEDRSFEDGRLVERTLDSFAQADDGTVHHLGEDVDDIEDGRVVGHGGAWRVGRDTRAPGVAMPARPEVGDTWRFEDVPGVTVEDDTVVTRFPFVEVAGGAVHGPVIRVREDLSPEGVGAEVLRPRRGRDPRGPLGPRRDGGAGALPLRRADAGAGRAPGLLGHRAKELRRRRP